MRTYVLFVLLVLPVFIFSNWTFEIGISPFQSSFVNVGDFNTTSYWLGLSFGKLQIGKELWSATLQLRNIQVGRESIGVISTGVEVESVAIPVTGQLTLGYVVLLEALGFGGRLSVPINLSTNFRIEVGYEYGFYFNLEKLTDLTFQGISLSLKVGW